MILYKIFILFHIHVFVTGDSFSYHDGVMFSTMDRDNDEYDEGICSQLYKGGWWYKDCFYANLNGLYVNEKTIHGYSYNVWWNWINGVPENMKNTVMMVRKRG